LQEACDRLRRGYLVKHVAYELGFKDAPHFCRKFKGHYGLSPLAFLAQVAEMSLSDN
jgi:AraC-like DNA-binding protein